MASFPVDVGEIQLYRGDTRTLTFVFKDGAADGPPLDLSTYGSIVTASARKTPDGAVLLTLDTSGSDLAGGIVTAGIAHADWDAIGAQFGQKGSMSFDIQIADATRVTTVVAGKLKVSPDYTHDAYGAA